MIDNTGEQPVTAIKMKLQNKNSESLYACEANVLNVMLFLKVNFVPFHLMKQRSRELYLWQLGQMLNCKFKLA